MKSAASSLLINLFINSNLMKEFLQIAEGFCLSGVNTMANYEQVLHLIRYKNWHTEALFDRKFKLVCSELNGRYISNDFKVEVRLSCSVPQK